jgi:hypothetical protein
MARVKQFADDLGISKNKAQSLINKGRSRKDGGSQILESVMKPKKYGSGGTNSKAPVAKVNTTELDRISFSKAEKDYFDAIAKNNTYVRPKTIENSAGVDEAPGDNKKAKSPKPKQKPMLKAALERLKKKDKAPISKRKAGGQENFGMLSVKAGIDKNPNATQADRIAGATKNMRGGGIAIQGLGFRGVK